MTFKIRRNEKNNSNKYIGQPMWSATRKSQPMQKLKRERPSKQPPNFAEKEERFRNKARMQQRSMAMQELIKKGEITEAALRKQCSVYADDMIFKMDLDRAKCLTVDHFVKDGQSVQEPVPFSDAPPIPLQMQYF